MTGTKIHNQVLVVESNPIHLSLLVSSLEHLGCEVESCDDHEDAIDIIAAKKPNFVFLAMQDDFVDAEEVVFYTANFSSVHVIGMYNEDPPMQGSHLFHQLKYPIDIEKLAIVMEKFRDATPMLDSNILHGIMDLAGDDDPDFLSNLVGMFYARFPELADEISKAIKDGDAKALERSAHSLKGSCGNIGAMQLVQKCQELERMGRETNLDHAGDLFAEISAGFAEVKEVLDRDWLRTVA